MIIFISIFIGIIVSVGYIWYSLYNQLYEEKSWTIGVGLFGALSGGICTLIAVIISTQETRRVQAENKEYNDKQLDIVILNEQIDDYKKLLNKINEIQKKFENEDIKEFFYPYGNEENSENYDVEELARKEFIENIDKLNSEMKLYMYCILDDDNRETLEKITSDVSSECSATLYSMVRKKYEYNGEQNIGESLFSLETLTESLHNDLRNLYIKKYNINK